MVGLEFSLALCCTVVALALRPWRALPAAGPPWPWLAWCALLPLFWAADRMVQMPVAMPLSGACLLMLMCGWPLAVLALLPVAAAAAWLGGLDAAATLEWLVWLGLAPATLALALGAALRRWMPNHLCVYILGRGFFATTAAVAVAGVAWTLLHAGRPGLADDDLMLARFLTAWGDGFLCGMIVAIFVAFRPAWLATYADPIYLPGRPGAHEP